MKKRGELTSSQIIGLILTLMGFAILLIVLLIYFDFSNYTNDEVCRLSVLTRATSPEATQSYVPLECTTNKICITFTEDCEQFNGEDKKTIETIKLPKNNPAEAAKKIEETTALAMYDCWSMMGQGKLNLFGNNAGILKTITALKNIESAQTTCVICSRVALSDEILSNTEIRDKININNYLENTKVPGSSLTYLQTFTDQQVRAYPKEFEDNFANKERQVSGEIAMIFMQILTEETPFEAGTETATRTGAFVLAGTSGLGPFGKILSLKTTSALAIISGAITGGLAAYQTYNNRALSATYCSQFTFDDDTALNGCSIVSGMDYQNITTLNKFCSRIEGNP